jgi:hypothetical protein
VNRDAVVIDALVSLPLVFFEPDQLSDAVQPAALVDDHVNVVEPPLATLVGFAVMVTVGCGVGGAIVTFAVAAAVPPRPVQVNVNADALVIEVLISLPLVFLAPDQLPEAVQLVALVDDHVSVAPPPLITVVGLAVMVTVGGGATATFAVAATTPPAPLQVSV